MSTEREALLDTLRDLSPRLVTETVRFYSAVADQLGIHVTDLYCLGELVFGPAGPTPGAMRQEPVSAGDLATRLGMTTGAITRVLDRLERAGYVRREPDPNDRRRVLVRTVPDRMARVMAQFSGMAEYFEAVVPGYTDDQLRFLAGYMRDGIDVARSETDRLRREGRAHATRRRAED